jgi:GH43 family beta-xylosidase
METKQLVNKPLVLNRADPWIHRHTDGYYYFIATVPNYDAIELRKSATLADIAEAEPKTVWRKHAEGKLSELIWAPEIHFVDGKWYIYFAAAWTNQPINGIFDHRMFVIENGSADPLEGEWVEKGQIVTNWESFSLDATTFEHAGTRYLVWAQKDPDIAGNSNLYIAKMDTPWSIEGEQVLLTKPEYDWECIGFLVNEGPSVIKRNGRIFLTYSASATDHHYCMGMLTASDTADLLDPASWEKSRVPVFASNDEKSLYGPGHNGFTVSKDGKDDILVFHARSFKETDGDPLDDPNRHTYMKTIGWRPDGTPDFEA